MRAARYVMRRYHNTSSVSDMMEHLQWPTLAQRRCCLCLTMLFKIKTNIVAIAPSPYTSSLHMHSATRTNCYYFFPYRCNTEYFKLSFFSRTIYHSGIICLIQQLNYNFFFQYFILHKLANYSVSFLLLS